MIFACVKIDSKAYSVEFDSKTPYGNPNCFSFFLIAGKWISGCFLLYCFGFGTVRREFLAASITSSGTIVLLKIQICSIWNDRHTMEFHNIFFWVIKITLCLLESPALEVSELLSIPKVALLDAWTNPYRCAKVHIYEVESVSQKCPCLCKAHPD